MRIGSAFIEETLPEWDPIICHETTDYGWRALTENGEVLEVRGNNIVVPNEIVISHDGVPVAKRTITNRISVDIDVYLNHFNKVISLYKANDLRNALMEADSTLNIAPTLRAKFNRSMIKLASGNWNEGMKEYWDCEQNPPFRRPQVEEALAKGLTPWRGEPLEGKKLLLLHAHGFGDTIQMLRYVPAMWGMCEVRLNVPPELALIAGQFAHPLSEDENPPDYFCPILHLLHHFRVTPESVEDSPYISTGFFRDQPSLKKRVGVAWSVGKPSDGDYPREIQLTELILALGNSEIEFHSVQIQNKEEAKALGVRVYDFKNFSECAELMMNFDAIISVDTAALHLAGAIGHRRVYGLLSHWASWRWIAPWYGNVKLCRQETAGDWASALRKIDL